MPTRNISLTEHFDQFVEEGISSGRYANASEVVRDALRLLELKAQEDAAKLAGLRAAIEDGFADIDQGKTYRVDQLRRVIVAAGKQAVRRSRKAAK
jgi:antitoxin ParD1/3/4